MPASPGKVTGQTRRGKKKFCARCQEWHSLRAFQRSSRTSSGYESSCVPSRRDLISVGAVQVAVLDRVDSGLTSWSEIAFNVGFVNNGVPGTSQVRRRLGLLPFEATVKKGVRYEGKLATKIRYDLAVRLARAAGLDPVDVEGL